MSQCEGCQCAFAIASLRCAVPQCCNIWSTVWLKDVRYMMNTVMGDSFYFYFWVCAHVQLSWNLEWGGDRVVEHLTEKTRHNSDAGSIAPCCKVFSPTVSFQCRLSYTVPTAPVCSCMHQHLCTRYKSQTLTAIPLFGYRKMLHTQVGMGSAALGAAVSYPGKATWISHSGQRGTNV